MDSKICKNCNIEKDIDNFYFRSDTEKHRDICKVCDQARNAKRYEENKEEILEKDRIYKQKHREEINAKQRKNYKENRDEVLAQQKIYYENSRGEKGITPRKVYPIIELVDDGKYKECSKCGVVKSLDNYYWRRDNGKYRSECVGCHKEQTAIYLNDEDNHNRKLEYNRNRYQENRDEINAKAKVERQKPENKRKKAIKDKEYYEENKDVIIDRQNEYLKRKYREDPGYRVMRSILTGIKHALFDGYGWEKEAYLEKIDATREGVIEHFTALFSASYNLTLGGIVWMTFNNYGSYDPETWVDDDYSTHTWTIDHVVPKSLFKYSSMDDPEFKECWSLENLRPYSAKQNLMDGVNRTRHKKENK